MPDIRPGPQGADPSNLTNLNGTLYFTANNGTHGPELWKTDGMPAGTMLVADIRPGALCAELSHPTNVNGTLFHWADDGVHGYELWSLHVHDPTIPGDMDIDGDLDFDDIDDLALALNSQSDYEALFGVPASLHGVVDRYGDLDFDDIDDFALALNNQSPAEAAFAALATVGARSERERLLDSVRVAFPFNGSSNTNHNEQWVTAGILFRGNEVINHVVKVRTVLEYRKPQLDDGDAHARKLAAKLGSRMLSGGTISRQSESHPIEFRRVELLKLDD